MRAEDYPHQLASQHALARAFYAKGHVKEAVELLEHLVVIQAETLAEDHPDHLVSEKALAYLEKITEEDSFRAKVWTFSWQSCN